METTEREKGVEQEPVVVGDPDILLDLIEEQYGEGILALWEKINEIPELSAIAAVNDPFERLEQLVNFFRAEAAKEGKDFMLVLEQWYCAYCANWK